MSDESLKEPKKTHGGARKGAGMPKGYKLPKTLDKLAARDFVRQTVIQNLQPLIEAQLANAQGLKYLVTRNARSGKFERVSEERMKSLLDGGDTGELEQIEVWDKDPCVQAFTDLLNRALDKPKEQEQEIKISASDDLVAELHAARARMSKAKDDEK